MNRVKNGVFLVRKWSYTTFNIVNIRKMWEKKGKIQRTRSMTKKRSSENFPLKMEIFPEIGPRKNFWSPPNSAPGLRPCLYLSHIFIVVSRWSATVLIVGRCRKVISTCRLYGQTEQIGLHLKAIDAKAAA